MAEGTGDGALLLDGLGFAEGPTITSWGALVVVSIDQSRVYEISEGNASVIAETDAGPNGATEGPDGVLYLTHFAGAWPADLARRGDGGVLALGGGDLRWVTREPAAPNDLCFGPDGLLYCTDPERMVTGPDGKPIFRTDTRGALWRCDVETGKAEKLDAVEWYPNGLAFDADDNLWVADTYGRRLVRMPWTTRGLGDPVEVIRLDTGKPDGFAFDAEGNVLVATARLESETSSTVQAWTPDGRFLGMALEAEPAYFTNVAISDTGVVFATDAGRGAVVVDDSYGVAGLPLHPFR